MWSFTASFLACSSRKPSRHLLGGALGLCCSCVRKNHPYPQHTHTSLHWRIGRDRVCRVTKCRAGRRWWYLRHTSWRQVGLASAGLGRSIWASISLSLKCRTSSLVLKLCPGGILFPAKIKWWQSLLNLKKNKADQIYPTVSLYLFCVFLPLLLLQLL